MATMPNQHTKGPRRGKTLQVRIYPDEVENLEAIAEARNMTPSDIVRERCGWRREDGRPNGPWSNSQGLTPPGQEREP